MKKVISLLLVVVFVLAFSSVAFALSEEMYTGLEKSPAFDNDAQWVLRYEHETNDLWFNPLAPGGTGEGRIGIPPEQPALNAEAEIVCESSGDQPSGSVIDFNHL